MWRAGLGLVLAVVTPSAGCSLVNGFADLPPGSAPGMGAGGATSGGGAGGATSGTGGGAAGGSAYAALILSDGPVAYYRLGDLQRQAFDSGPQGHHGKYFGDVRLNEPGALAGDPDGAARFRSSGTEDGYVEVADIFDFVDKNAFSLEAWVKTDAAGNGGICGKNRKNADGSHDGYRLYFESGGELNFKRYRSGSGQDQVYMPGVPAGQWVHVVATFDGMTMHLYVDGQKLPNQEAAKNSLLDTGEPFSIARYGGWFRGWLDEVAVYDRGLSAEEVTAHYDAARGF
jgi:hypothetical protein